MKQPAHCPLATSDHSLRVASAYNAHSGAIDACVPIKSEHTHAGMHTKRRQAPQSVVVQLPASGEKEQPAGQGCCVAKAMLAGRCNNCACSADGGSVYAKVCRAMPLLPLRYAFSDAMQCKHATNISTYMKCTQSQNMLVLADTIAHSKTTSSTPAQRAPASDMPGAKDAIQKPQSSKGL